MVPRPAGCFMPQFPHMSCGWSSRSCWGFGWLRWRSKETGGIWGRGGERMRQCEDRKGLAEERGSGGGE